MAWTLYIPSHCRVIYPKAISKGEQSKPQGEQTNHSDEEESDTETLTQRQTRKRKAVETAAPSSSATATTSTSVPAPKKSTYEKLIELGLSTEEAEEVAKEHEAAQRNKITAALGKLAVDHLVTTEGTRTKQIDCFKQFDYQVTKKARVNDILVKMDKAKYQDVLSRRKGEDAIVSVRCTKPKTMKILTLHLKRQDPRSGQYPEVIPVTDLAKYGYTEWLEIQGLSKNHKGILSQELNLALTLLISKVRNLGLIPAEFHSESSSAPARRNKKKSYHVQFLQSLGSVLINNIPPAGVNSIPRLFIREPVHGVFYQDEKGQMCFQRTDELFKAPTVHLFHLRLELKGHRESGSYHWLISLELSKRRQELLHDDYKWIKQEIMEEAAQL